MKITVTTLLLATIFVLFAGESFSQTSASGTWGLTVDASVIVAGNVTANLATGGTGIGAISFGPAGIVSTGWNSASRDTSDYYQFMISPLSGNNFNINSTSFTHSSSSSTLTSAVYYSTNNGVSFTQIGSNISVSSTQTPWSDSTHITVNSGTTLILRVYGWAAASSTYKFRIKSLVISGTTSSSLPLPSAPTLISPANYSISIPISGYCNWTKPVNTFDKNGNTISNYWFELSTDSTFSTSSIDSTLTDTTKIISDLNYITKYYWRVKAKNQTGWGSFSSVWEFTTIVPLPGVPTLISPEFASIGNPLNLNLIWTKPANSENYNVVLSTDTGFTSIILNDSTLTDSVKVLTNLNTLTTYYWKVRAKSLSGWSSFSETYNFKTVGTATQVLLSSPANGATNQPVNITFHWFKAVDQTFFTKKNVKSGKSGKDTPIAVSNYWFEFSTDSTFATGVTRDTTLTDSTNSLTGLSHLTKYYWRVKAKNQIGWGSFSSTWNLTTIIAEPVAPVLSAPANNSTGISLTPALTWNSVTGAVSYRVQVSVDSLFETTQFDSAGITGTTVTVPAGKLSQNTQYYWRVKAANAGGNGSYSVIWNFRTLALSLSLNLKVYLDGFWNGTNQISDTTIVFLASSTTPFAFVDTAKVVLSSTGLASMNFNRVSTGSYYIVVNHRNHLETWSATAQAFVGGVTFNYDFTTAVTQAFGNNMKQVGSVWVLYGGDANRDGSVDAMDVIYIVNQFGAQGYLETDFNGDQDVTGADIALFVSNFGMTKIVPTVVMNIGIKNSNYDQAKINVKVKNTEKENKTEFKVNK